MLFRFLPFFILAVLLVISAPARADQFERPLLDLPALQLRGVDLSMGLAPAPSAETGPRLLDAPAEPELKLTPLDSRPLRRRTKAAFALAMVSAVTAGLLTPVLVVTSLECDEPTCGAPGLRAATALPLTTFAGWAALRATSEPMSDRRRAGTVLMYLGGGLTTVAVTVAMALIIVSNGGFSS